MDERPDRWDIHRESPGHERPADTAACVEFIFGSGRTERYTEEELREKIADEGRAGDDPFVKAYRELTG
jgi:hypothetical protein